LKYQFYYVIHTVGKRRLQGQVRKTIQIPMACIYNCRANPFPKVTDLICRLPLHVFFQLRKVTNFRDLMRLLVRLHWRHYWSFKDQQLYEIQERTLEGVPFPRLNAIEKMNPEQNRVENTVIVDTVSKSIGEMLPPKLMHSINGKIVAYHIIRVESLMAIWCIHENLFYIRL